MVKIDTSFLARCLQTLEEAHNELLVVDKHSIRYDLYRSACIKEFEIIIELSGKLLRKALTPYLSSVRAVQGLIFKDVFRQAGVYQLLDIEQIERWLSYRDNRNELAHDYGVKFAEKTLIILPQFMQDVAALIKVLEKCDYD